MITFPLIYEENLNSLPSSTINGPTNLHEESIFTLLCIHIFLDISKNEFSYVFPIFKMTFFSLGKILK